MIGGDDMYMPLCRTCHSRETKSNKANAFIGDPSKISVEVEEKEKSKTTDRQIAKNSTGKENIFDTASMTPDTSDGTIGDSIESNFKQAASEAAQSTQNGPNQFEPLSGKFNSN